MASTASGMSRGGLSSAPTTSGSAAPAYPIGMERCNCRAVRRTTSAGGRCSVNRLPSQRTIIGARRSRACCFLPRRAPSITAAMPVTSSRPASARILGARLSGERALGQPTVVPAFGRRPVLPETCQASVMSSCACAHPDVEAGLLLAADERFEDCDGGRDSSGLEHHLAWCGPRVATAGGVEVPPPWLPRRRSGVPRSSAERPAAFALMRADPSRRREPGGRPRRCRVPVTHPRGGLQFSGGGRDRGPVFPRPGRVPPW